MNEKFLSQMKEILKDEYPSYLKCLEEKPIHAFRINPLKCDAKHLFDVLDIKREPSPYANNGYYTDETKYGNTPEYLSGAFYMQEASASAAVTVLNPKPNMKVLDLCAAPGSKTTQILEKMNNQGLLVSNEYDHKRSRILLENVERNGASNCIVLNNDTKDIAKTFDEYFDMVLCDAPCSGEGMMRKNDIAIQQWSTDLVAHCASLQKEILENAYLSLKKGGTLVYSTCTLNLEENEYQIKQFLDRHTDMHVVNPNVSFGRKGLINDYSIDESIRIYPMDKAEGHFICKMVKDGTPSDYQLKELKSDKIPHELENLLHDELDTIYPYLYYKNNHLYGSSYPFIDVAKCNLVREFVYIGEMKKGRFEFSHHFFMSSYSSFKHKYEMNDNEVKMYLHGEQISGNVQKGWVAMCYHGFVIGGAKSDGSAMKNKYPKAFRTR